MVDVRKYLKQKLYTRVLQGFVLSPTLFIYATYYLRHVQKTYAVERRTNSLKCFATALLIQWLVSRKGTGGLK